MKSVWSLWHLKDSKNGSFWGNKFIEIDFTKKIGDRKILKFPHCETSFLRRLRLDLQKEHRAEKDCYFVLHLKNNGNCKQTAVCLQKFETKFSFCHGFPPHHDAPQQIIPTSERPQKSVRVCLFINKHFTECHDDSKLFFLTIKQMKKIN